MKIHSDQKIKEIKQLRESGYSINEIVRALGVPKTTVWHHIKNILVPEHARQAIRSKRGGSALKFQKDWAESEVKAREILAGNQSELAISAAMLYWGEGGKKGCNITNTDPKLIQLYLKFLYEVLHLSPKDILFVIRIFTGMNWEESLAFWSGSLNVPEENFLIRYNDGGNSGKTKYGICRISVKKGSKTLKLMHSLIRLSFSDIMGFNVPVAQWIDYRRPSIIKQVKTPSHSSMDRTRHS